MKKLRPPVKTHGGKYYLCNWVIEHFPDDYKELNYCEPCCGGASVFLNKEKANEEVISDLDKGVVSIFKALRDEPKEFIERLKKIKYTEEAFEKAQKKDSTTFDDYVEQAVNEYVLRRMSRGGLKKAFAWSERLRGGQPGDVNAWETMLKMLPILAERVKDTVVLNNSFKDIIKVWDCDNVLIYIDPPYLPTTRAEGSQNLYENEMSVEDHIDLLGAIRDAKGKVIISGYNSPLYNKYLKGWKIAKKEIANHSSQQKSKERRFECLWMNY
jgi:DNA adenine methylase